MNKTDNITLLRGESVKDGLQTRCPVFPREVVFPDAADLYDEFRKEANK